MRETQYTIPDGRMVVHAGVDERADFLTRTYAHLFGAVIAFVLFEVGLFAMRVPDAMLRAMAGNQLMWLLFLGGFVIVGGIARHTAHRARTKEAQYAALLGYVAGEAILFSPLLLIANVYFPGAITAAAIISGVGFTGLTAIVFFTRKDFSFLRGVLMWGGLLAMVVVFGGPIFGFYAGMWFSVAMVGLAGGMILYDTSNVLHRYPSDRHVAASLELFASLALLFWYVLRIVMEMQRD